MSAAPTTSTGSAADYYSTRWRDHAHVAPDDRRRLVDDLPGGFWKQDFADHALLFNVHFPPPRLVEDMQARLPALIGAYPTPQWGMTETLAEAIGQTPGRLAIGNGVTELIIALVERMALRVAVPTPSFNEFERAASPDRLAPFALQAPDFELDVDAYAAHCIASKIDAAIVISPNNPTSRAVPKTDLLRLADLLGAHGVRLIVDESFIDFAPKGRAESLEDAVEARPGLVILKSLGKVWGVGGLRLGYLLSSDPAIVDGVKAHLPIWNINTLADYFISVMADYRQALDESLVLARADRDQLYRLIASIDGVRALKPHANYLFCRIPEDWPDGSIIVDRLLADHDILIRHCGIKTMAEGRRYLRIASKTQADNARLAERLVEAAHAGG